MQTSSRCMKLLAHYLLRDHSSPNSYQNIIYVQAGYGGEGEVGLLAELLTNSSVILFIWTPDQISQQRNHKCHKRKFYTTVYHFLHDKKIPCFLHSFITRKKNHTWAILGVPGMIGFHYGPVDELNPNGFSVPPVPPHLMYTWPFIGPRYDPVLYQQTTYFSARTYYLMLCLPPLQSCERKASIDGVLKSCIIYNLSNMGCTCMPNWPLDPFSVSDHIAQIYKSKAEG